MMKPGSLSVAAAAGPSTQPLLISGHGDRGARQPRTAITLLRAVLLLAILAASAAWLPHAPSVAGVALCVGLGLLVAVPDMTSAAIKRGHDLAPLAANRPLRRVLGGASFRILVGSSSGTALAAVLLLHLTEGSSATWAAAIAMMLLTLVLIPLIRGRLSGEAAGIHVDRYAREWTRRIVGLVVLAVYLGVTWNAVVPATAPAAPGARSALVAEALEWHRILSALGEYAFGLGAELLGVSPGLAGAIYLASQAAFIGTLASLALVPCMPQSSFRRAFGRASDEAEAPPPDKAGVVVGASWLVIILGLAAWADQRLAELPPAERPSAQALIFVEKIEDGYYHPGTLATIDSLITEAEANDRGAVLDLRHALEAGFDQMEANVDIFLDGYYSLWADYMRTWHWLKGDIDDHLQQQLTEALGQGDPFSGYAAVVARIEVASVRLAREQAAIMDENRIAEPPPALLRLAQPPVTLPVLPDLPSTGMASRIQERVAVSASAGIVSAIIADRIAARLARRGMFRLASRALSKTLGFVVAFGVDYALVRAEEHLHRDAFRAEIVEELEALRSDALSALQG